VDLLVKSGLVDGDQRSSDANETEMAENREKLFQILKKSAVPDNDILTLERKKNVVDKDFCQKILDKMGITCIVEFESAP
jgi:hypothetical protein